MDYINQVILMTRDYIFLLLLLIVFWFILFKPLLRLFWGLLKNAFFREKNIYKKFSFKFDEERTEFQFEKTETKKINFLERLRQGEEIKLSGGSDYKITYFVYPKIGFVKKLINWDKKYITLKIEPK